MADIAFVITSVFQLPELRVKKQHSITILSVRNVCELCQSVSNWTFIHI